MLLQQAARQARQERGNLQRNVESFQLENETRLSTVATSHAFIHSEQSAKRRHSPASPLHFVSLMQFQILGSFFSQKSLDLKHSQKEISGQLT